MKQAVILAAGEGRRLRPFTVNKPKAMIYIAGKPIIQYVLESLASNGIRDIILIVGYKREQIYDYIGNGNQFGVDIKYITQSEQLGTAHALAQAISVTQDEFLVLPGDKLITPDTIVDITHCQPFCILVKREENSSRYSVVKTEDGLIIDIMGPSIEPKSTLINTGIYVMSKDIFKYIGSMLDIPDVIRELLNIGTTISAVETDQSWLDVVYPWDILKLNTVILHNISSVHSGTLESGVSVKGKVSIGKGTIIRTNSYIVGPVVIGDGCEIGPNTCIFPSTSLGNNVVIAPFTQIKNSIISDDVHIGSGGSIEDSIIDKSCNIAAKFCAYSEETEMRIDWQIYMVKIGAMIGEGCKFNTGVVACPGLIAGNYCNVKSLTTISGILTDKSIVV
jgi:UDP-N-acetylglucosamine diphosphorylase / glucose-1-phosphate thymidylyltransferase / UDP-N-acetylgalactosamine diphosphorylase / glucosamine-1-phosphate N-acetyltransferase / galactosamine-1-phosphate N-acetyltransferase